MNTNRLMLLLTMSATILSHHTLMHPLTFFIENKTDSALSLDGYVFTTNIDNGNTGIRPWPQTCSSLPCRSGTMIYNQIGIPPRSLFEPNRNRISVILPDKPVKYDGVKYHFNEMLYYVITMHDDETGYRIVANIPTAIEGTFPLIEHGATYTVTTKVNPTSNEPMLIVTKTEKNPWRRNINR